MKPSTPLDSQLNPTLVPIEKGWAKNAVNATIFRQSSVISHGQTQYVAYYHPDATMTLAKRQHGEAEWQIQPTPHKGNTHDAHNVISLGVDGAGYLHVSWDHHSHPLNYARSVEPGSLTLGPKRSMTGTDEDRVTYPEFFNLPQGDLVFMYRDGASGRGNTILKRYDVQSQTWRVVQNLLIDGEGERNGYTNQLAFGPDGSWHLSWCWRETPDVATNHDICYAKSTDQGQSWQTSQGERYTLPITQATAEVVAPIPQNRSLINQTSMTVTPQGQPLIASYWHPEGSDVPQYHLVYLDMAEKRWHSTQVSQRKTPFTLGGGGSRRVPLSRPKVLADAQGQVHLLFRDAEFDSRIMLASSQNADYSRWHIQPLSVDSVNMWEPSYDTALWAQQGRYLHLFHQYVGQGDGETLEDVPSQMVSVLECDLSTLGA